MPKVLNKHYRLTISIDIVETEETPSLIDNTEAGNSLLSSVLAKPSPLVQLVSLDNKKLAFRFNILKRFPLIVEKIVI
jgi:hypothetical protein